MESAGFVSIISIFQSTPGTEYHNYTAGQKFVKIFDPPGVEIRSRFFVRQYMPLVLVPDRTVYAAMTLCFPYPAMRNHPVLPV